MTLNGAQSIDQLIAIRDSVAQTLVTEKVTVTSSGKWQIKDGAIQHTPPAFFEIVGVETADTSGVLIEQRESALVAIITKVVAGERYYLLAVRAEPGLQMRCVLTSTIQSTPSNLNRTHGGKPTDYYEYITNFDPKVRVIYESVEYDYGFIYLGKSKKFMVLEVDIDLEARPNFVWVSENLVKQALGEDYLVGTDLRALLAVFLLAGPQRQSAVTISSGSRRRDFRYKPLAELSELTPTETGFKSMNKSFGFSIDFFKTHSPTRENSDWIQPLISFQTEGFSVLPRRRVEGQDFYGVISRQEFGMMDKSLFYPAIHARPGSTEQPDSTVENGVMASLEGGRFFESNYVLGIIDWESDTNPDCEWISKEQLFGLLNQPMRTSVELRMAASLLIN